MSPRLEISKSLMDELKARIDSEHPDVETVISSLLKTSGGKLIGNPLYAFTCSKDFRVYANDADRYLALLAKIHELHPEEFMGFVAGQRLRRRYFGLSKDEVCQASRHNQARRIPSSKYWAIMNIDTPTKRRFLKRLLIYIDYPDEMVSHVRNLIGNQ